MAFRRAVLESIGGFDVELGVGSPTKAAEDTDLVFRASWAGFAGEYLPRITVRHHHGRRTPADGAAIDAAYDVGRGAFYCKHLRSRGTRQLILRNWYWRIYLRSAAGRRRLANELRGTAIYLWNHRRQAADAAATGPARGGQPVLP